MRLLVVAAALVSAAAAAQPGPLAVQPGPLAAQAGPFPSDAFPTEEAGASTPGEGLNTTLLGVYNARAGYADVWGYVAPDGREYALGALQSQGLVVLDVSGAVPVEVGFVPSVSPGSDSKEVETYGRYAYVVNEFGPMQIVDLVDPANPTVVGLLDTQPGVPNGGSHTHAIVGDRLYVHGGRNAGGVRVYSLANPLAPALLGGYAPFYIHDIGVRGTTLYAAGIYGDGIDVLDASDPAAITRVSLFNYPGSGPHNVCLTEDGRYAFVGDEIGSAGRWTRIFDVRDPQNVEMVGEIALNPDPAAGVVVHNCYVRGDRLFIAHYTEGMRVFDISTPAAPVEVAFYDTYTGPSTGTRGVWAVYPYLPSGKILISDRTNGIFVVRLNAPVASEPDGDASGRLAVGPNPVRSRSRVSFSLGAPGDVRLSVADVLGREVAVLDEGARGAGPQHAWLDGRGLPAGTYVVRLSVDGRATGSVRATVVR
jgi:choice-of-anchor B domain-containing protein